MARFDLRTASGDSPPIDLGQIDIGLDDAPREIQMVLTNRDSRSYSEIRVGPEDRGIQLARDQEGAPGAWAEAGEEIIVRVGVLPPNRTAEFWARIAPNVTSVGDKSSKLIVKSVAID